MNELPKIKTERLILRSPCYEDIPFIVELANDPEVHGGTLNMPSPYFEKNAISWINMSFQGFDTGERYIFSIEMKETGKFIGGIGFHLNKQHNRAELGYWIGKSFWNKGYCTEALKAIIHYGFSEINVNKFIAGHFRKNLSSGMVMKKCRMIKEAELSQHVQKGEDYLDIIQYRITKNEYEAKQS